MNRFHSVWMLVMLCTSLLLTRTNQQITKGDIRSCISSSEILKSRGLGNTPQSCMDCDPTLPRCSSGCQGLVKDLYYNCDAICLPQGYYFNPTWTLSGCWETVKPKVKISVERCGCNSAHSSRGNYSIILVATGCLVVINIMLTSMFS